MEKKEITLQFANLRLLWSFRVEIGVTHFIMNPAKLTLTCHCPKELIELAIEKYGAKMIGSREMA